MSIKVVRDFSGVPTLVEIRSEGRTYKVTYDQDKYTFSRTPTPQVLEMLKLVYPFQKETVLSIPEPLTVNPIAGGSIILFDDMEDLLKWVQVLATVAVDNTVAFSHNQSLKITCAAVSAVAQGSRRFGPRDHESVECVFSVDDYANLRYLGFGVNYDIGTIAWDARIHYDANNMVWQFLNAASAYENIPGSNLATQYTNGSSFWHYIKFDVNYIDQRYGKVQIDNHVFNLSNQPLRLPGSGGSIQHNASIFVDNDAGLDVNAWIDDFIVKEVT